MAETVVCYFQLRRKKNTMLRNKVSLFGAIETNGSYYLGASVPQLRMLGPHTLRYKSL